MTPSQPTNELCQILICNKEGVFLELVVLREKLKNVSLIFVGIKGVNFWSLFCEHKSKSGYKMTDT